MASATASTAPVSQTTQFLITVDRREKQRWKTAADQAGLSIAEYVRRAVGQSAEAPTEIEIAEARALAAAIDASVDRMTTSLEQTIARIDRMTDPRVEELRRAEIYDELERSGTYLDLDALASASS